MQNRAFMLHICSFLFLITSFSHSYAAHKKHHVKRYAWVPRKKNNEAGAKEVSEQARPLTLAQQQRRAVIMQALASFPKSLIDLIQDYEPVISPFLPMMQQYLSGFRRDGRRVECICGIFDLSSLELLGEEWVQIQMGMPASSSEIPRSWNKQKQTLIMPLLIKQFGNCALRPNLVFGDIETLGNQHVTHDEYTLRSLTRLLEMRAEVLSEDDADYNAGVEQSLTMINPYTMTLGVFAKKITEVYTHLKQTFSPEQLDGCRALELQYDAECFIRAYESSKFIECLRKTEEASDMRIVLYDDAEALAPA